MMHKKGFSTLREALENQYTWPALYTFKFIAQKENIQELKAIFPAYNYKEKNSKNGNYISLTMQVMMSSSNAVIDIYRSAYSIKGVIAL